ncbi:ORF6N domain-containing protein [Salmonella enterica]|nr:ORF6N domain-containing protein [Salmonella enterica]
MTTQISAENLSPLTHNNIPVITTDFLANLYGTKAKNISDNYLNNTCRFVVGKHFFKLEKDDLREFKNRPDNFGLVGLRARSLILWTERGAARHAKMLETDRAWEVFEKLEDCYFNRNQSHAMQTMVLEREAITQLNLMFSCVEHLRLDMWPHLSAVLPGLNSDYHKTFVKLAVMFSLLKKERAECKRKAEKILSGH